MKKEQFSKDLLTWYDANKRMLPWREEPTPYRVWVSEIMLQQTRVEAVKPYFHRFMEALPTLSDLAQCEDIKLAKLWEGLGYYNRVRNMKKCAILCMEHHHGELPTSYAELLQLPGIGEYTAGAIASIAYQEKVCAVDGNVLRVFARLLMLEDDILKPATKRKFQAIIETYLPLRVDAFNQALMELGATICVPNGAPRCNICPVASYCLGYQKGKASYLPIKTKKQARRKERHTILCYLFEDSVHLIQRPQTGLLANLNAFDMCEGQLTKKQIQEQLEKEQIEVKDVISIGNAKHIFSHVEWHMKGYLIVCTKQPFSGIWADLSQLQDTYAIPSAYQVYKDAVCKYLHKENKP